MIRRPKLVLIDVDGTLVDSVPDLAFCVDAMLEQMNLPRRGEDRVRQWVGNGVERLVKRALINRLEGEPEPALFARALPLFLELYSHNTAKRSRLYPGVVEGLAYLKHAGYRLGAVTNKIARFTEPLLTELDARDYFALIVSGDTLPKQKPDPLPLQYAAEQFELAPQDCLMVGDSSNDVAAARAAGFQIVCVSYGYNHGEDIRTAYPDAVIDSFTELAALFEQAA